MTDTASETAAPAPAIADPAGTGQPARNTAKANKPQSARQAHQVLERLFQLYPKMFGARFLPLKLGVFQDTDGAAPR